MPFSDNTSLEDIRRWQAEFAKARDWDQFHSPRNLTLALVGEVGELCECFQWKSDELTGDTRKWSSEKRKHLGQEMSDVLFYLIRLADRCHIDLPAAAREKLELNAKKYSVKLSKGSSAKYTELRDSHKEQEEQKKQYDNQERCTAATSKTILNLSKLDSDRQRVYLTPTKMMLHPLKTAEHFLPSMVFNQSTDKLHATMTKSKSHHEKKSTDREERHWFFRLLIEVFAILITLGLIGVAIYLLYEVGLTTVSTLR
eukprot:g3070.t1